MTTIKELTCEDRIKEEMKKISQELSDIFDDMDNVEDEAEAARDEAYDQYGDYALAIETRQSTVITLSYGGPASYLEVIHEGRDIISVTFRFSDWFDTAVRQVSDRDVLYRYAVEQIEAMEDSK